MRFVLVALALAACQRAAGPATPANKAPAPDYHATADDELGFLPVDADLVLGFNGAVLMKSQLWHVFEPQLMALSKQFGDYGGGGSCGEEMMKKTERVTFAMKMIDRSRFTGVIVMRGADMARGIECNVAEVKRKGGTVTVDRGVTVATSPTTPGYASAMTLVGPSTAVIHLDKEANYDTLSSVLRRGAPLRGSPTFMKLYDRRERGSSLWGMANGNSPMFDKFASSGMRPKSIDGTMVATNRLVLVARVVLGTPTEANALAAEITKVKGMAANYVTRLDVVVTGPTAEIQVELSEGQIRALVGMLAGAMGP